MSYLEKNYFEIFGLIISLSPYIAFAPLSAVIIFVLIVLGHYLISTSNGNSNGDSNN